MMNVRMFAMAAATVVWLGLTGCATKKHVREAIAPVQQQVNQVQKDTDANKRAIGDLDRSVASADEKAQDAGRKAQDAMSAANQANSAAQQAGNKADAANSQAQQAMSAAGRVDANVKSAFGSLDNYKLEHSVQVFFKVGQSVLSKEAKDQLDQAVSGAGDLHDRIFEVEGFADRTGSKAANEELARRRADAVTHYLTVDKNVPLRNFRVLGVGSDFPNADNKTRAARQQNRRVDVRIYARDLKTGQ